MLSEETSISEHSYAKSETPSSELNATTDTDTPSELYVTAEATLTNNTTSSIKQISTDTTYYSAMDSTLSRGNDSGINSPSNDILKNEEFLLSGMYQVVDDDGTNSKQIDDFEAEGYLACSSHDVLACSSHDVLDNQDVSPSCDNDGESKSSNDTFSNDSTRKTSSVEDSSSLIILSSSHITPTSSRKTSRSSMKTPTSSRKISSCSLENTCEGQQVEEVDRSFIKKLIHDAYEQANDTGNEQASLQYDEDWEPSAQSSPSKHHKVFIRELSFDELTDVKGIDLMAPVFLAVTDEPDDSFKDLRRKAKSIEDLCSTAYLESDEDNRLRHRSKSELPLRYQSQPLLFQKNSNDTNFHELTFEEEFYDENFEQVKQRLTSTMSNFSEDFSRLDSIASDQYNESIDDDLEDQALIDVFVNHGMQYDEEGSSFDMLHDISDSMINKDESELRRKKELHKTLTSKIRTSDMIADEERKSMMGDEKGETPSALTLFNESAGDINNHTTNTASVLWEYPDTEPGSPLPTLIQRQMSINTSPTSPSKPCSPHDRFIVVNVAGQQRVVDMKLIEPYLKILSHGGQYTSNGERRVIVVFTACYLPLKTVDKYNIIMEQLFYYFAHAVDLLVHEAYEVVFFNSPTDENLPSRTWIKQCYNMVNYRLKKNLRRIYFVHQSIWLTTLLTFSQLFVRMKLLHKTLTSKISSKFRRKIFLVRNITRLKKYIPMEYIFIPPEIYRNDKRFS